MATPGPVFIIAGCIAIFGIDTPLPSTIGDAFIMFSFEQVNARGAGILDFGIVEGKGAGEWAETGEGAGGGE